MFVYKHTETIEYDKKVAYFLRKIQYVHVNNLRSHGVKNAKFSGYCFDMNINIKRDFQIYISVLLSDSF